MSLTADECYTSYYSVKEINAISFYPQDTGSFSVFIEFGRSKYDTPRRQKNKGEVLYVQQ